MYWLLLHAASFAGLCPPELSIQVLLSSSALAAAAISRSTGPCHRSLVGSSRALMSCSCLFTLGARPFKRSRVPDDAGPCSTDSSRISHGFKHLPRKYQRVYDIGLIKYWDCLQDRSPQYPRYDPGRRQSGHKTGR